MAFPQMFAQASEVCRGLSLQHSCAYDERILAGHTAITPIKITTQ